MCLACQISFSFSSFQRFSVSHGHGIHGSTGVTLPVTDLGDPLTMMTSKSQYFERTLNPSRRIFGHHALLNGFEYLTQMCFSLVTLTNAEQWLGMIFSPQSKVRVPYASPCSPPYPER